MESVSPFTRIDPDLVPVLDELRRREPIFHTAAFGATVARRYSRDFILGYLERFPPVDAETEGWVCSDFGLGSLGPQTYLLTYTLDQAGRVTRRATIWQRSDVEWRVLYHQGTLVVARVDDTLPSKRETSPQ